jgi:hypothetical protein
MMEWSSSTLRSRFISCRFPLNAGVREQEKCRGALLDAVKLSI